MGTAFGFRKLRVVKGTHFAAVLLLVLVFEGAAQGDVPQPSFTELNEIAVGMAKEGRFAEAIDIWRGMLEKTGEEEPESEIRSSILKNMGNAHFKLGNHQEAWYFLDLYVKEAESPKQGAVEALRFLEQMLTEDHYFRVAIHCSPERSQVFFGQGPLGWSYQCPLDWWFRPGEYPIHVASHGHRPATDVMVMPEQGGIAKHLVMLEALPKPVDNLVGVAKGGITGPGVEVEMERSKGRPAQIVVLATGVATLVGGAVCHYVGYSREQVLYDKYNGTAELPAPYENQDKYDDEYEEDVRPLQNWSYGLYAAGGVLAAGGLIWLVVDVAKSKGSGPEAFKGPSPFLGPGQFGAQMEWSF